MTEQEAVRYVNSLCRYVNEKDALTRIVYEQHIMDYEKWEVPTEAKEMCLIELYRMVVNGPWSRASQSLQHGNFRQDIGSETVTAAVIERLRSELKRLLKKYDMEEEAEEIDSGGLSWVDENSLDV